MITVLIIFNLIFLAFAIFSYRLNRILYAKNKLFEEANNEYDKWVTSFKNKVFNTYTEMKKIDASGAFEAEDEVGVIFTSLREIIDDLYDSTKSDFSLEDAVDRVVEDDEQIEIK